MIPDHDRSEPNQLAKLLRLDPSVGGDWTEHELGELLSHQLRAPLRADLAMLGGDAIDSLRSHTQGDGNRWETFAGVLFDDMPPIALLTLIKTFAKTHRSDAAGVLPNEIATTIYFLAIAAAAARHRQHITALTPKEVTDGFAWLAAQPWVDQRSRVLAEQGRVVINVIASRDQ